jgi:1,2-phenylacetyl-CoA epoxidase catalytic subunit
MHFLYAMHYCYCSTDSHSAHSLTACGIHQQGTSTTGAKMMARLNMNYTPAYRALIILDVYTFDKGIQYTIRKKITSE